VTSARKPPPDGLDLSTAKWQRSPAAVGDEVIEIAHVADYIAMRNSADPDTPPLIFTPAEWAAFTAGVKNSEFDFVGDGPGEPS
jgi:Domain of unknown function (DUF397)